MISARLQAAMQALNEWCKQHKLAYDIVCDESSIQGIKLFTKDSPKLRSLLQHLQPALRSNRVHLEYKKVRSGTIFAFSLQALTESQFQTFLRTIGEEPMPASFLDKLDDAFMLSSINEGPESIRYRGYTIDYRKSPSPARMDYEFCADDYDGPGDPRCGLAPSLEVAKQHIDDLVAEHGGPEEQGPAPGGPADMPQPGLRQRMLESARRIAEDQYKTPESAAGRTSRNRASVRDQEAKPQPATTQITNEPIKVAKSQPHLESRLASTLGAGQPPKVRGRFAALLDETLQGMAVPDQPQPAQAQPEQAGMDGMATPSGAQPSELYQKFARALQVLGQSMGIGPLQEKLKAQGIKWKTSDDGMSIILFVLNAATKAPQPIARISSQTLENPGDFESQLSAMLDFAKGQAPGTEKQRQEEMQATQKAIGQIAKSVAPAKDEVAQAMGPQQGAAPAPPQAPAPVQPQAQAQAQPAQRPQAPQPPRQQVGM